MSSDSFRTDIGNKVTAEDGMMIGYLTGLAALADDDPQAVKVALARYTAFNLIGIIQLGLKCARIAGTSSPQVCDEVEAVAHELAEIFHATPLYSLINKGFTDR